MSVGERSAGGGGSTEMELSEGLGGLGGGTTSPAQSELPNPVDVDSVRGTWYVEFAPGVGGMS